MKSINVPLRLIAVLGACTALAGCLSSGGVGGAGGTGTGGTGTGGTTTGGLTVTEHDAAVKRVTSLIPSSNVPTSGTASYAGGVKTDLYKGTSPIGTLLGDLAMTIDFSKSGATQGITGEITNIRGKQGTADVTYSGKLTTEDAKSKGFVEHRRHGHDNGPCARRGVRHHDDRIGHGAFHRRSDRRWQVGRRGRADWRVVLWRSGAGDLWSDRGHLVGAGRADRIFGPRHLVRREEVI